MFVTENQTKHASMIKEKVTAQKTPVKAKKKKKYKEKYTIKMVYHINKLTIRKVEKILLRTSRSYSSLANELFEKHVSNYESKHGEIKL